MRQCEIGDHKRLFAVRRAAVILAPRQFAGIGGEIFAGNVVVSDLGAAGASKETLGLVRARAIVGIGPIVIDALRQEGPMQPISMGRFVCVHGRCGMHAGFDRRD